MSTRAFTFCGKLGKYKVGNPVANTFALPLECLDCVIDAIEAVSSVMGYYSTKRNRKFLELVYAEDLEKRREFLNTLRCNENEKIRAAQNKVMERINFANRHYRLMRETLKKEFETKEITLQKSYELKKKQEEILKPLRLKLQETINIITAILNSIESDKDNEIDTSQMEETIRVLVTKYKKYVNVEIGGI